MRSFKLWGEFEYPLVRQKWLSFRVKLLKLTHPCFNREHISFSGRYNSIYSWKDWCITCGEKGKFRYQFLVNKKIKDTHNLRRGHG